jgi:hypothetical protein
MTDPDKRGGNRIVSLWVSPRHGQTIVSTNNAATATQDIFVNDFINKF